jgi:putative flippase GtrA
MGKIYSTGVLIADKIIQRAKNESRRLFIFIVIGLSSLGLNLGLYTLLSRVLWPTGNRAFEYALSVIIVTIANFEANCHFTFRSRRSTGTLFRFGLVALAASVLNAALFWLGHAVLHLYDLAVIVGNTAVVAVFTFSSHRLFTFHPDPWRHVRGIRR